MTRFREFTYEELNDMEKAFSKEGLRSLACEVRKETEYRYELGHLARKAGENEVFPKYEECVSDLGECPIYK